MSKWSDVDYKFETEVKLDQETAGVDDYFISQEIASSLTHIVVNTTDGRKIQARVHQATRSVYPMAK